MSERKSLRRWGVRASVGALLAVLCFLAGFSIVTQSHQAALSRRADVANAVSNAYQDARFWVGQEESLERKYRLEPSLAVVKLHDQAEQSLAGDLRVLVRIDPSSATRAVVRQVLSLEANYIRASDGMFLAVDAHKPALVIHFDHAIVDPVFGAMQDIVFDHAASASQASLAQTAALRRSDAAATTKIALAFGLGVALLLGLGLGMSYFRRRLDSALRLEVKRLSEISITDPLTGLRNHRAFHEDLSRSLQRAGRTGVPVALALFDLDELKKVNDNLGHGAGDDLLTRLASVMRETVRGSDCAYRIGGDEFAVILDGTRAWHALEFTQRLQASMSAGSPSVSASAGIAEGLALRDKDTLIREADLALLAAKRSGQSAAVYTPEMGRKVAAFEATAEEHTQTLASALALAVDAKDAYTRSHSQTVSQLSALIATELGFDPARIAKVRVAGLLHDVGKIGIPDAILTKPEKLTTDEYNKMKTHSLLGHDIVAAAGMPTKAHWIRHHHERFDGLGYPEGMSAEEIPLESRIIFVADSFDAMTSDRPYRDAPGRRFAIDELRRHAGTQFDPDVVEALCRVLDQPAHPGDPEQPVAITARQASVA